MDRRDGLNRMIDDCLQGKIDFIIIKSLSRFARNTVDCLQIVRRLCEAGVYIFFEKENINTQKMKSELLLSILSSLAQSESESISSNEKWSIQKRYKDGTFVKVIFGKLVGADVAAAWLIDGHSNGVDVVDS